MPVFEVGHPIEMVSYDPEISTTVAGPPGTTAIDAGGTVCARRGGEWVPTGTDPAVTLDGSRATFRFARVPGATMALTDAWISYKEN